MNETLKAIEKHLRIEFEMDDDDVREMEELFIESMTELSETATNQLKTSNTNGLSDTGHAIKGAAANVGALVIAKIGKELETASKAEDIAKCAEHTAKFAELVSALT
ncbi:MAG: Hpt domain-containing protein [Victivallales bacterium]|nr:Hpt domain-containing protein [Victivallales bacterium]